MGLTPRLVCAVCSLLFAFTNAASKMAPNQLLGTCLTSDWVKSIEASLKLNASERDNQGRLVYPFLHAALRHQRHRVDDARTASAQAYSTGCIPVSTTIYGAGILLDGTTGTLVTPGSVNGSLVLELSGWMTHSLATLAFAILASEVYGYSVSLYDIARTLETTQRMSSVRAGQCTPTHGNVEVWLSGKEEILQVYANESYEAGPVGYVGRSGLYTTSEFVKDAMTPPTYSTKPMYADFWKDYKYNDDLIAAVPASRVRDTPSYFPAKTACADNTMGCLNGCSRTHACTLRDPTKECMVVVMMFASYDPGYLQAVMANLDIPAYFCFLGYGGAQSYVLKAVENKWPVLFYHYEPDLFHIKNPNVFERIYLPRPLPERTILTTSKFGENGYGEVTSNPVDVDFPDSPLVKFSSSALQRNPYIAALYSRFTLQPLDINNLLKSYADASASATEKDPTFRAACDWVKANYKTWSVWMDRLPVCTLADHIRYDVTGCTAGSTVREIKFAWHQPDPDDVSRPDNCDGGVAQLPASIVTSRSCEWILGDTSRWPAWIKKHPECDESFYNYSISECGANTKRTVTYSWLLPDPAKPSRSLECTGGITLPDAVSIDCEFMPMAATAFKVIVAIDMIVLCLLLAAIGFVYYHRDKPIIKRSQYELLILMIIGGVMICIAVVLYAGEPTRFLCAARPFFISTGFTTIFGALFVKSLRVYRVFMRSSLKRMTVTTLMMLKVYSFFIGIDILILATWLIADFPEPTVLTEKAQDFRGSVDRTECKSSSFLFTAVLIFWKAIVLLMGFYLSFLVRNVSADFQESIWIFASSVVVLVARLVIVPLAYVVKLPGPVFYVFLACTLMLSTGGVMGMMLLPKIFRLKEAGQSQRNSLTNAQGATRNSLTRATRNSLRNSLTSATNMGSAVAKYIVTAVDKTEGTQQDGRRASAHGVHNVAVQPLGVPGQPSMATS
ncbi:hypothetical protein Poli38472_007707 [Pythium oligandrum]|uniref:G-protein coupled receptors family 3 profile domain-containing protein n=1 Tax=Pythium oligandrum TaxID=41045 RepID=A0A8K1CR58_PYTOL|nr:hypothetical protein Poli38472_007707 [Pythium oligandrum]|eukprot:TMW68035.1 hypothetical protein Poli38472_007707 [Pythium oligandrum]